MKDDGSEKNGIVMMVDANSIFGDTGDRTELNEALSEICNILMIEAEMISSEILFVNFILQLGGFLVIIIAVITAAKIIKKGIRLKRERKKKS